ncbi:helix-turn-helix transcriptional regulator [Undibacterium curvum]|uniref:helix-turn-helix transcriptional regulator n=1 Tax=Undibacterium curvum TaxID=2762294 RepID=UPI003D1046E1
MLAMDMDIDTVISKWVRSAREHAGLSGEQLGAKLAVELGTERGNTKANISHWENERHQPSMLQMLAISRITGMKLPPEFADYLSTPKQSPAEIPNTRSAEIYALGWHNADELEILTQYRLLTEEARSLIRQAISDLPKEKSRVRAIG